MLTDAESRMLSGLGVALRAVLLPPRIRTGEAAEARPLAPARIGRGGGCVRPPAPRGGAEKAQLVREAAAFGADRYAVPERETGQVDIQRRAGVRLTRARRPARPLRRGRGGWAPVFGASGARRCAAGGGEARWAAAAAAARTRPAPPSHFTNAGW